jgi:hypothetical protein
MSVTKKHFPGAFEKIKYAYANNHTYGIPIWERLPFNVMKKGIAVCDEVGISDRSVRHTLPCDFESNYNVLREVLSAKFYLSFIHGASKNIVKPFHELAEKLERGTEDVRILRKENRLASSLLLDERLVRFVEEILDKGKSSYVAQIRDSREISMFNEN